MSFIRKRVRNIVESFVFESDDELFERDVYYVVLHTSNSSDIEFTTEDFGEAKRFFDGFGIGDIEKSLKTRSDLSIVLDKQTEKYKFVYQEENPEDYPIDTYYDVPDIYKLMDSEYETIDLKNIEQVNSKTEEILLDVQIYFKKKYGSYKYNKINIENEEGEVVGCINLRIADHTENIFNVDRYNDCKYHLSVVIADFDKTKDRFGMVNSFERGGREHVMEYNSEYSNQYIINEIEEKIEELKEEMLDK